MEKKEADEHTTVELTPFKDFDSDNTLGNRDVYGHVYDGDDLSAYSRKMYKTKCQFFTVNIDSFKPFPSNRYILT